MITQKNKHQTAFFHERLAEVEKEAEKIKILQFKAYAKIDLLDWNGNLVCKYNDLVSVEITDLGNGQFSALIKGNHNTFYFTKGTKNKIKELLSTKKQTEAIHCYIGNEFVTVYN